MKVIINRAGLLDAINNVSAVVAARTPRPQLTGVRLTARKAGKSGELILAATDAEISLRLTIAPVEVVEPGDALIPADKLRQIISAEEHEPTLTLEAEGDDCHVRGGDAHFKILGFPAADFPPLPEFEKMVAGKDGQAKARTVFSQSAGLLNTMISRTVFATARENSRYAINGVLLKRDGKRLEMVATDGRRLALCRQSVGPAEKDSPAISCIVPTKALALLQRLLGGADDAVQIAIGDNQILFSIGTEESGVRAVLSSNLVEGAFPPYEDVIPKDQDKRVVFDRDLLSSAVRRAGLLTNEESRGVRMKFNSAEKQVELSSRSPEMGEAQVQVDATSYEGDNIEIGFNPQYITDALKVIADPEVILELKAPNKPGLVKSGTDFVYVVMPVNLQ